MLRHYEVDKGRFEAGLVRASFSPYSDDVLVAFTDGDIVRKTEFFDFAQDHQAVEEFASSYGLEVV